MNNFVFFISIIMSLLCSCEDAKRPIKILPLSPYSVISGDSLSPKEENFRVDYFFISGITKGDNLQQTVDSFVLKHFQLIRQELALSVGGCYFYFYKESDDINSGFIQKVDGIFSNTLDEYSDQLMLSYCWDQNLGFSCTTYKNGEIGKVVKPKILNDLK